MAVKKFLQMVLLVSLVVLATLLIGHNILYDRILEQYRMFLLVRNNGQVGYLKSLCQRLKDPAKVLAAFEDFRDTVTTPSPSWEFILFRKAPDSHIEFLYTFRQDHPRETGVTPYSPVQVTPFWLALKGQSGTVIDNDHRGARVLAAYGWVPELGWGVVSTIDLKELQQPYRRALGTCLVIALVLVLAVVPLLFRITHPLLKASQENEKKFRSMFMAGSDAAYLCAVSSQGIPGPFLEVNDSACRMLGFTRDEFMRLTLLGVSPPDKAIEFSRMLEDLLREKRLHFEWTHVAKDGRRIPVEISTQAFEMDGKTMVLSVAHDITLRRQSEARIQLLLGTLDQQNAQLKKLDEMKDDFLSSITHELRTPLTSIKGYLKLLLGGMAGGLSDQQKDFAQTALNNSDRLYDLVNDLLDLSRLESGRLQMRFGQEPVGPVLQSAVSVVKNLAEQKGQTLETVLPDEGARTLVDREKIERVLINLLSNAIKFTPKGGRIEVGVKADRREGRDGWHWWVKDNGIGIPAEAMDKVFEKFYQVENANTRHTGGTGLGLAICKRIAEGHGGSIWVESTHGEQTVFHFFTANSPDPTGAMS